MYDNILTTRTRRSSNWWEPIFEPNVAFEFRNSDWKLRPNDIIFEKIMRADDLNNQIRNVYSWVFKNVKFMYCDFSGNFDFQARLVFINCDFIGCDFGLSDWRRAKFSQCKFIRVSISQTVFELCEFRKCSWYMIGVSGNETEFRSTELTNPEVFLKACWTNLNPEDLKQYPKEPIEPQLQFDRLQLTKAATARALLNNLATEGQDRQFYEAVQCFERCQGQAYFISAKQKFYKERGLRKVFFFFKVMCCYLELKMTIMFGYLNNWGASPLKPLAILFGAFVFFAVAYCIGPSPDSFTSSVQKSFHIATIGGYTLEHNKSDPIWLKTIEIMQLVSSLVLYTTFFTTVVARFSRVR